MVIARGDIVQLKVEQQGRRYRGKVTRIKDGMLTSSFPNGLEATQPIELWEICEKGKDTSATDKEEQEYE